MKFTAISQRIDKNRYNYHIDNVDHQLINYTLKLGLIPAPVPNNLILKKNNKILLLNKWLNYINPSLIIISGGGDINLKDSRYYTEMSLIKYAYKKKLPLLGICRGMQLISHWAGVKLKKVEGHVNTRHHIDNNFKHEVNSFHKFSIKNCPKNFIVNGRSKDGEIESIVHKILPWKGIMWHPEREEEFNKLDIKYIRELLN